jgi:hypothetical protein
VPSSYALAEALARSVQFTALAQGRVQLEDALRLCDEADRGGAEDTERVWGLLIDSDIALRLGDSVEPTRTEMLWRAVVSAGRSIAIDDSSAAWVALSSALDALSRTRTAELASRVAEERAPDPGTVVAQRIHALTWAGRQREVFELLENPELADSFGPGWVAATRARSELFAGRLDDALKHANSALAMNPDDAWTRGVRAEILTAKAEPTLARKEWEWVWQHAPLDEFYGHVAATWAALGQDLVTSALDLARELIEVERVSVDDGDGHAVLGIVSLLLGDESGWNDLEAAAATADSGNIGYMQTRIRAILGTRADGTKRLGDAFERRARELDLLERMSPTEQVATEMGLVIDQFTGDSTGDRMARVGARLTRGLFLHRAGQTGGAEELSLLAAEMGWPELEALAQTSADVLESEPPAPMSEGESDESPVPTGEIVVSSEDPSAQLEIVYRYWPDLDALARFHRHTFPTFEVSVEETVAKDGYLIKRNRRRTITGTVPEDTWYCRRTWIPALPSAIGMAARDVPELPDLVAVPAPTADDDMTTGAIAWSPFEFVARRATGEFGQPYRSRKGKASMSSNTRSA